VSRLIKLGAVQTIVMGRPDEQLCDRNSKNFVENLSCLRAASDGIALSSGQSHVRCK
jgi:hypothetical protein